MNCTSSSFFALPVTKAESQLVKTSLGILISLGRIMLRKRGTKILSANQSNADLNDNHAHVMTSGVISSRLIIIKSEGRMPRILSFIVFENYLYPI